MGLVVRKEEEYANFLEDPDHLIAVASLANKSKGARGPEEWKPPNEGYWCQYATVCAGIKERWDLTMTEPEAVVEMLYTCEKPAGGGGQGNPGDGDGNDVEEQTRMTVPQPRQK